MFQQYYEIITNKIDFILKTQSDKLSAISDLMYETVKNDGIIHLFGSGHSHIISEDCFYRAGGFAPVNAILYEPLMLHKSAVSSTIEERKSGIAGEVLDQYFCESKDILFIFSNSGINSVPIEMAISAKEKGITVIAITSMEHSTNSQSRHTSGKKLYEVCDYYIDNGSAYGDATIDVGMGVRTAPISSITSIFIMQGLFTEVARKLVSVGINPPVYKSANIEEADEYNTGLINKYKARIKHL